MDFLKSPIMLAAICAYTYYVLGAYEAQQGGNNHGIYWAAFSLGISLAIIYLFKGGWGWLLVAQVSLFIGIAIFRAVRQP